MLNKIITALENLNEVKTNCIYKKEAIETATEMYNSGWDKLEDGTVILYKGNVVAIKDGNNMVKKEMSDFSVRSGKLSGSVVKIVETKEVREDLKNSYLAQAIITKFYTLRKA